MKKIIAYLAVFLLMASGAMAELPNITGLSKVELLELQTNVLQELSDRNELPSFSAPIGYYEAGKDFPFGKYLITPKGPLTYITIYENAKDYRSDKPVQRLTKLYSDDEMAMTYDFVAGMIVDVGFSPACFEPYYGLEFE